MNAGNINLHCMVVYLVYIIMMWWCVHVHMYVPIGGNGCGGSTCVCVRVCAWGKKTTTKTGS